MADVSVNMGVSGIAQFKQGMSDAAASVKALDAAMKNNEKQLKATGDQEAYMASQSNLLQSKIASLRNIVKNAEQALKQMEDNGVKKTSKAYQDMQRQMIEAQGAIMDTEQQMGTLGEAAVEAAGQTDKLATSLGGLNKKVSLEQVIGAIGSVTTAMEKAAGKAVDLGKKIWDNVMDSAKWADDSMTMALMYGVDLDTFLRVQKLVTNGMDTSVEAILGAQSKLKKNVGNGSDSFMQTMRELGLLMTQSGKYGDIEFVNPDSVALFWEAGQAIMALGNEYKQEADAQELFGKSWKELVPLFDKYKSYDEFKQALKEVEVNSVEDVSALAELNDKVGELKGNLDTLSNEVWAKLAPALTDAAEALNGLLTSLLEYLDTDDGKQMLAELGDAVSGLFKDLSTIDPQSVIEGFTGVFNTIIDSLKWLVENKDGVVKALEGIVTGWATLKLTGGALQILKLLEGIQGLFGASGATGGSAGGIGGLGGKLLASGAGVGLTTAAAGIGSALTMYDPTGLTGLILPVAEDQTAFLRTLRNGGSLEEAAAESGKAVEEAFKGAQNAWVDWGKQIVEVPKQLAISVWNDLFGGKNGEKTAEVKVEPKTDEEAAAMISAQIGTVSVPVKLVLHNAGGGFAGGGGGGGGLADYWYEQEFGGFHAGFANGLPLTPFDGWYYLHKNERVTPAREVSNRSYNSNLYVENMNMSGGMDAQALAAAMSAQNRRISAGYGS